MNGLESKLKIALPLAITLYGCSCQPEDTGRQRDTVDTADTYHTIDTSDTYVVDTDADTDADSDSDTDGDTDTDTGIVNTAPTITTTSLPSATTQTAYTASIAATDAEGDRLSYSIISGPSWLSINSSSGVLSGTPTSRGTSSLDVKVSDGVLDTTQTYSLTINPISTVDLNVYDAGNGDIADPSNSCNITVILENATDGSEETARVIDGIASFEFNKTGIQRIYIASTNTGSNCYGGFEHDEWLEVSAGTNSSWVTLIPESYQDEVRSVVGSQLDMSAKGYPAGNVDSVRDLFIYMLEVDAWVSTSYGWNDSIRDGTTSLKVDTISDSSTNDSLELAINYWDTYLAPSVTQVSSGGDIWFALGSSWSSHVPEYSTSATGVYTMDSIEIEYRTGASLEGGAMLFAHELGHSYFSHTNIPEFIMDSSPSVDEPHELELLEAKVFTNVGNATPSGYPLQLNGYYE